MKGISPTLVYVLLILLAYSLTQVAVVTSPLTGLAYVHGTAMRAIPFRLDQALRSIKNDLKFADSAQISPEYQVLFMNCDKRGHEVLQDDDFRLINDKCSEGYESLVCLFNDYREEARFRGCEGLGTRFEKQYFFDAGQGVLLKIERDEDTITLSKG